MVCGEWAGNTYAYKSVSFGFRYMTAVKSILFGVMILVCIDETDFTCLMPFVGCGGQC